MLDDPLVPSVNGGKFDLKASMMQRDVYQKLMAVTLALSAAQMAALQPCRAAEPTARRIFARALLAPS